MSNRDRAFLATQTSILLTIVISYLLLKILISHIIVAKAPVPIWLLVISLSMADLWFIVIAITSWLDIDVVEKMLIIIKRPKNEIF